MSDVIINVQSFTLDRYRTYDVTFVLRSNISSCSKQDITRVTIIGTTGGFGMYCRLCVNTVQTTRQTMELVSCGGFVPNILKFTNIVIFDGFYNVNHVFTQLPLYSHISELMGCFSESPNTFRKNKKENRRDPNRTLLNILKEAQK